MRGRIITSRHETWELPELLSWELLRTGSVPCDSFEALCPYTAEMAEAAHLAVSFLLLEGERLLLHGIVDEVVTEETAERGRTVCFRGRGYAARLLDNESPPMVYQGVTLREILRRHVTPYGIRCRDCAETKAEGEFTVAAGSSQWKVLEDFCRVYGGFVPRFDRYGELLAVPERDGGERLVIDDGTELLSLRRREDRRSRRLPRASPAASSFQGTEYRGWSAAHRRRHLRSGRW